MRTLIIVILLSTLMVAGCGNNSSNSDMHDHGDGSTHTHEDGNEHQHHDTLQQQEFTVDTDSGAHENHGHIADTTHNHPH